MFGRKVTSPDGRQWKLGRRWMPRRRRLGRADISDMTPDWFPDFDDFAGILLGIVVVVVGAVLILVLFNVIAIAIELTIVIVALIWGVVARVVFRRPWAVYAVSGDTYHVRQVVGWRASRRAIDELEQDLRSGVQLQPSPGYGG